MTRQNHDFWILIATNIIFLLFVFLDTRFLVNGGWHKPHLSNAESALLQVHKIAHQFFRVPEDSQFLHISTIVALLLHAFSIFRLCFRLPLGALEKADDLSQYRLDSFRVSLAALVSLALGYYFSSTDGEFFLVVFPEVVTISLLIGCSRKSGSNHIIPLYI